MNILVRRCLRRTHLVEELVEAWQIERKDAQHALDRGELVQECLELSILLSHGWEALLELLFDEQIDDLDAAGRTMRTAVTRALEVFEQLRRVIAEANGKQGPVAGVEDLGKAAARMNELKAEIARRWPAVNRARMDEAMAAYKRGEYQSAGDMLHELQGDCAQAD